MNTGESYNVIGVMSGSSLDGIDIALVNFKKVDKWQFEIIKSDTVNYTNEWKDKLNYCKDLQAFKLLTLNKEFGKFIGKEINEFVEDVGVDIDFIASHGHTIFHQPDKGITYQVGDGYCISTITGKTVISDFRSMDVALGGQGAPMVPIGDLFLFPEYDYCLNLGGFGNISYDQNGKRIAFDICPINTIINFYARRLGKDIDRDGKLGKQGKLNEELLKELNSLSYYNSVYPKSLGREWLQNEFIPVIEKYDISDKDKLRTLYEHISDQIVASTKFKENATILTTGGGAYNKFLLKMIRKKINHRIIIPDENIVDFKEAVIFAFLGLLRVKDEINCLASVTGAQRDSICGITHRL